MTKILSQSEVAAIRERAAKATPGPWEVWDGCSWRRIGSTSTDGPVLLPIKARSDGHPDIDARREDLDFCVASRADVPTLCDTVDALRAKLEVAKAALQGIVEYWNGAPESAVDAIETVADRAHNCLASLKEPQ